MSNRNVALPHLAAWRKWAYMSQAQLAEKAGVSIGTVKTIEARRREKATYYTATCLAEALSVPLSKLVNEEPPTPYKYMTPLEKAAAPLVEYLVEEVMKRLQKENWE